MVYTYNLPVNLMLLQRIMIMGYCYTNDWLFQENKVKNVCIACAKELSLKRGQIFYLEVGRA